MTEKDRATKAWANFLNKDLKVSVRKLEKRRKQDNESSHRPQRRQQKKGKKKIEMREIFLEEQEREKERLKSPIKLEGDQTKNALDDWNELLDRSVGDTPLSSRKPSTKRKQNERAAKTTHRRRSRGSSTKRSIRTTVKGEKASSASLSDSKKYQLEIVSEGRRTTSSDEPEQQGFNSQSDTKSDTSSDSSSFYNDELDISDYQYGPIYALCLKDFKYEEEELEGKTVPERIKIKRRSANRKRQLLSLLEDLHATFKNAILIRPTTDASNDKKVLFLLISPTVQEIRRWAETLKIILRLHPSRSHVVGFDLGLKLAIHFGQTHSVWQDNFSQYEIQANEALYMQYPTQARRGASWVNTPFREVDILYIVDEILNSEDAIFGLDLDDKYEAIFESSFPLHNEFKRRQIKRELNLINFSCCCGSRKKKQDAPQGQERERLKWRDVWPMQQPIDLIEQYFGQKIAFYFEFLRVYTKVELILPALSGVIMFVVQRTAASPDGATIMFCCIIILNSLVWRQYHLRNEAALALHWGCASFEPKARIRPEYHGVVQYSAVDGGISYDESGQMLRLCFLLVIMAFSLLLIGGVIASASWVERYLEGTPIVGTVFAVVIAMSRYVTKSMAVWLTDYQNPRTVQDYEQALLLRLSFFDFVINFGIMYYTAFLKTIVEGGCGEVTCAEATGNILRGVFISMIIIDNTLELGVPWVLKQCEGRKGKKKAGKERGTPEEIARAAAARKASKVLTTQYKSPEFEGVLEEYEEIFRQFGYVTFFSALFPLSPLLALVSNMVEVNVDSSKLLSIMQRPQPYAANSSGNWNSVLTIFICISILTNAGIVIFVVPLTKELFSINTMTQGLFAYVLFLLVVVLIYAVVIVPLVPSITPELKQKKRRQESLWPYLLGKKKSSQSSTLCYSVNLGLQYDRIKQIEEKQGKVFSFGRRRSSVKRRGSLTTMDAVNRGMSIENFFTGSSSPVEAIKIRFEKGKVIAMCFRNADLIKRHKDDDKSCWESVFTCGDDSDYGDSDEELDPQEESGADGEDDPKAKMFSGDGKYKMFGEAAMKGTGGTKVNNGIYEFIVPENQKGTCYITDVRLRLDVRSSDCYARIIAMAFEINFDEKSVQWIGAQKGGHELSLKKDLIPNDGGDKNAAWMLVSCGGLHINSSITKIDFTGVSSNSLQNLSEGIDVPFDIIETSSEKFLDHVLPQLRKDGSPDDGVRLDKKIMSMDLSAVSDDDENTKVNEKQEGETLSKRNMRSRRPARASTPHDMVSPKQLPVDDSYSSRSWESKSTRLST